MACADGCEPACVVSVAANGRDGTAVCRWCACNMQITRLCAEVGWGLRWAASHPANPPPPLSAEEKADAAYREDVRQALSELNFEFPADLDRE